MASSHLSLVRESYKYPLGVKVSINFWCKSRFPPPHTHTHTHNLRFSIPKSTLWSVDIVVWVSKWNILGVQDLQACFSLLGIDLGRSRSRYDFQISRYFSKMVFETIYFHCVEILEDRGMHPTRSKNKEWRNLGSLACTIVLNGLPKSINQLWTTHHFIKNSWIGSSRQLLIHPSYHQLMHYGIINRKLRNMDK